MIDAAGDDDLVERALIGPAIVAVALHAADRAVLVVAAADQACVDAAGAIEERLDDLDAKILSVRLAR